MTGTGQRWKTRIVRGTELVLWMAAAFCLGVIGVSVASAMRSHMDAAVFAARQIQGMEASPPPKGPVSQASKGGQAGDVIGRLEIRGIGLSVPMTAGIEASSLLRGVGHIEGTAQPGGLGTLGLAGHRDTYFRPLRRVAAGMEVRVSDGSGTYHYVVDSTEIVMPEQVDVLAIRSRPEMTLVTCYPFDFVGAAPKRFIVHAYLVSAAPDGQR